MDILGDAARKAKIAVLRQEKAIGSKKLARGEVGRKQADRELGSTQVHAPRRQTSKWVVSTFVFKSPKFLLVFFSTRCWTFGERLEGAESVPTGRRFQEWPTVSDGLSGQFGEFGWILWKVAGGKGREEKLPLPGVDLRSTWHESTRRACGANTQVRMRHVLWCVSVSGRIACDRLFFVPLSGRRATQIAYAPYHLIAPARHSSH